MPVKLFLIGMLLAGMCFMPAVQAADPVSLSGISQDHLARILKAKKLKKISFYLVDLRIEKDFELAHLPTAVNIPLKKFSFMAEKILGSKSDKVILYGYSRGDAASANAQILLINKGYRDASLLEGGFAEWEGEKVSAS